MSKVVKVPVVMQMETLECGAACLAMILAYHGRWVPLEQIRSDCGVSRDGSNARNILRAARTYGLEAAGYRFEMEDIKKAEVPMIIHWNFNHFVVFNGFKKRYAVLNDPGRGIVEVPMEEFQKAFTGIALQFQKTDRFVPGGKPRSVAAFARERLKGTLTPFLFVIITGLLTASVGVISPAFSRVFLDRILTGQNRDWLYPFIIGMVALLVFQIVVSLINTLYMLKIRGKLAIVANTKFFWHVIRLPMDFFSQRMAGDIASRQASNETIAETLIAQLAPVLLNIGMLIFYLTVMLRYNPLLTCVGLVTAFLNILVARRIARKRINITRSQMRDSGNLSAMTMNGFEMIETIKASGAENGFFERWAGLQASVSNAGVNTAKLNQYLGSVPSLLQQLSNIIVQVLGVMFIMKGSFTTGMLLAFQSFMGSFTGPVNTLIGTGQSVQQMRTCMERIEDVMNFEPDVEYPERPEVSEEEYEKLSGAFSMKDVTFGYSKLAPPLIEHFNLEVKPGDRIAFVGASGCGKSTLAKLISRACKDRILIWQALISHSQRPQQMLFGRLGSLQD
jgi:ABC-type bacteriocin/lantibiotic exporter with double-glycine peptidase domain